MFLRRLKHKIADRLFYAKIPNRLLADIYQVAVDSRWRVRTIHQPFDVDVPIPSGVDNEDALSYYSSGSSMRFNAQQLICIPNGISCGSGFLRLKDGGFLVESTRCLNVMLSSKPFRRRKSPSYQKISGDCYCLRSCWGDNYAHWMHEDLPRLLSALPSLPCETQFIVPDNIAKWRMESLMALGIDQAKIISLPQHVEMQCERLWFATILGSMQWFYTSPDVAQEVSQKLIGYAAQQLSEEDRTELPTSEYLFISRQGVANNRLVNEPELIKVLDKLGFDVVVMERYSLSQQVEIIKRASIVVGVHGAGLTNMMFAKPGALMVELQDDSYLCPRPWYWKLANCFACRYKTIIGQTTKMATFENIEFRLDPVFFEMALSDICVSKSNMKAQDRDWYDMAWYKGKTQLPR
jgi:hypothetical protein